ncbi:ABC transporter permease [Pelomonas sp. V22]|uniref:ABC transporter permease n=1 Tax=Pelomonas sp. V22 TaxID=2822139 RepID=UPI0024A84001|nr:ABC transporter permease [Pelomonas sp. V22]MDI4632263.1 ABC transporter permease [Pelomonas sp. V22]
MNTVMRKLVLKELYLYRWLLIGVVAAGFVGLVVAAGGEVAFNVGFLLWMTALIALGVMLALFGVSQERKDRALLFVMSLPLSPRDYVRAKLLGLLLCFFIPWALLTAGAATLILLMPGIPDGLLVYALLLCFYLLLNYVLVLCSALHVSSDAGMGGVIILTNMSVTLFMMGVGRLPEIAAHMLSPTPVWSLSFWQVLGAEIGITLLLLCLPLCFAARRRDIS